MEVSEPVINKLFWVMKNQYGSYWVTYLHMNGNDVESTKKDWFTGLKRFTAEDIAKALGRVKELFPGKPPNLEEFVKLIKHVKTARPSPQYLEYAKIELAKEETRAEQMRIMRENGYI